MTTHASREQLVALRQGKVPGAESRALLNHVAGCAECQRAAREALGADANVRELVASFGPPASSPADEHASRVRSRAGETPARQPAGRRRSAASWLVAAAVLVLVFALLLSRRERPAPEAPPRIVTTTTVPAVPPPPPPERPAVVREVLAAGKIPMPVTLAAVLPARDSFRSAGEEPVAAAKMHPAAEVLETQRPRFTWPATEGATYTVLIGANGNLVAQSPELRENAWQCDVALARGRTYSWQVELRRGDETTMLPMPPEPTMRFHVLSASVKNDLDAARRATPDDHLLLGVLYARAGLREEALRELAAASEPEARTLAASIRAWRPPSE